MATFEEVMRKTYKPGEKVEASGLYSVTHDDHAVPHEVTCVFDEVFPPCGTKGCHPRFKASRLAHHVRNHKSMK